MSDFVLVNAVWAIGITLGVSVMLIRKSYQVRLVGIFILLYSLGQIAGYGFDVHVLKAVIPSVTHPKSGVVFQFIPSTVAPLVLAGLLHLAFSWRERQKTTNRQYKAT